MRVTQALLKKLLRYDPDSGKFYHKEKNTQRERGAEAGHKTSGGYVMLTVQGVRILAHRAAWLYMYGVWPTNQIDHDDGDRANNRIKNLFDRTCAENLQGFQRLREANKSGFRGVTWSTKCQGWTASFCRNGKSTFCGVHDSPAAANTALELAKQGLPFQTRVHRKQAPRPVAPVACTGLKAPARLHSASMSKIKPLRERLTPAILQALESRSRTNADVAKELGVHPNYLSAIFNQISARKPGEVNQARIWMQELVACRRELRQMAAQRVVDGRVSSSEAAAEVNCSERTIRRYVREINANKQETGQK